jgi:hypothetical protein
MSIDVSDLIHLAQRLVAGDNECEWRSGASRAYYAAYHKALDVADRCLPPSPYATGMHQQLTDRFFAEGRTGTALAYARRLLSREAFQSKICGRCRERSHFVYPERGSISGRDEVPPACILKKGRIPQEYRRSAASQSAGSRNRWCPNPFDKAYSVA